MNIKESLTLLIKSRCSLIVVETIEESRIEKIIQEIATEQNKPAYSWDLASNFESLSTSPQSPILSSKDEIDALNKIMKFKAAGLFLLKDFHRHWSKDQCGRLLKTIAQQLIYSKKNIIITTHNAREIPKELYNLAEVISSPLPNKIELKLALSEILKNENINNSLDEESEHQLLEAAKGLTYLQAQRAFAKAIVKDGCLTKDDINYIIQEKKNLIKESEALEYYSATTIAEHVGGLGELKKWLNIRKDAFSQRAEDFGLPAPKGMALIGIPGTGKSLSAKMVSSLWQVPLIRLDIGALFGSYVGESELKTRQALQLAEAVSPCVLWIDELEKGLAQGNNDSSTSTRVFGTILTWMSEKTTPCFVIATANDISKLPPELLRRGRFDEIFFLDLPTAEERKVIFEVHIKKRGRDISKFDIDQLVEASVGYVGAEIEHAVIDGMYLAFAETNELNTEYILTSIKRLVPLSVSQKERVAGLRNWLTEGRAQSASFKEKI